jgi:hypothetical protein
MAYTASVLNIMIAAPSDVSTEVKIAYEVVHAWNNINAEDKKVVLIPIGWGTHSAPSMDDSAQAIINSQVLAKADLLIAIFWTRLGTETAKFDSGTVEEIEQNISAKKPTLVYFSSKNAPPRLGNTKQFKNLEKFRKNLESRGLYWSFDSETQFRELLSRQLGQTIIQYIAEKPSIPTSAAESPKPSLDISEDARELILQASQDENGYIHYRHQFGGRSLLTNGRNFTEDQTPRIQARWEAVLQQLEDNGLIESRGAKREAFKVTDKGYGFVESINDSIS